MTRYRGLESGSYGHQRHQISVCHITFLCLHCKGPNSHGPSTIKHIEVTDSLSYFLHIQAGNILITLESSRGEVYTENILLNYILF